MTSTTLVEDFCTDNDEESIGEEASFGIAPPASNNASTMEKMWNASPPLIERPQSADAVSLADDLEVLELPPELGWLERATSLPGAGSPRDESMHESMLHDSLHSGIECTIARVGGSGFSRPDSRSDFCSRASTPESIVAELPELTSNPMVPSPTAAPPPERAKGKRAFMLPPRPQHGSTRSKAGSNQQAGAGPPRNDTPMPGAFSMPRPWSWRSSKA